MRYALRASLLGVLMASCLLVQSALAQEPRGFAEARLALTPGVSGQSWQLVERVRPTFTAEFSKRLALVATVEAGLAQGRDTNTELDRLLRDQGFGAWLDSSGWTAPEHRNRLLRIDGSDDYLDVDRLYLDFYGRQFDLRVGRQALNWGSARFFNPTDPFPEVLLAEPWRPRRGVNAVRVSVPFGQLDDVSMVVASNDTLDALRAATRVRLNVSGTDVGLIGAWRGDTNQAMAGVDLRGNLGVGWWVEAAYLFGDDPHEEISVGVDYSFPVLEQVVVFAQYYRNGSASSAQGGARLLLETERDPFAPFVTGRDYLLAGGTVGVLPELSLSAFALQNLNDGTGMVIPTVSWAALDWLEVAAAGQVGYALWGDGGELRPRAEDLRIQVPAETAGQVRTADLSGLIPTATVTIWARASF